MEGVAIFLKTTFIPPIGILRTAHSLERQSELAFQIRRVLLPVFEAEVEDLLTFLGRKNISRPRGIVAAGGGVIQELFLINLTARSR